MIEENYNTKNKKYDIIALDILIFILKPWRQSNLPFSTSQTFYDCSKAPILYQTSYNY